jgi:hypothetical protein
VEPNRVERSADLLYIENLRHVGCPEETVRDIIIAKVCKLYTPRLQSARAPVCGYWQRIRVNSAEADEHFRALLQERNALINDLLGVDLNDGSSGGNSNSSDPRLSFLSRAKADEFRRLEAKYADQTEHIVMSADGLITPQERDALEGLQRQKATEIDRLLTPDEKLEYNLRNSPLAQRLRNELGAFQPSESEFRAIYQAQAALQESETSASNGLAGNGATEDELKSALGEDRYAEYRRSKDPGYQCLLKVAERYGLPTDAAVQVFDLKQSTEAQYAEVMSNQQYTSEQKQAWLKAAHDQVGAAVMAVLGDKGFSVYHDYAGSWLDRLGR